MGHDQLFKELGLAFPNDLVDLMWPELVDRIDLAAVDFRAVEGFTDTPRGRRRHPDLVGNAIERGSSNQQALLHLEIERRFRTVSCSRALDYNRLLSLREGLPVHSAVLFMTRGAGGFGVDEYREESFGQLCTIFRYNRLGLSGARAFDYLTRAQPLAWALASLMRPDEIGSQAELAMACLRRIAQANLDPARRFLLLNCVQTYAVESNLSVASEAQRLMRQRQHSEVRDMFMTWADRLKSEGRQEGHLRGHRKGRQEGRQEGRQVGMKELLLVQAEQRFGEIPTSLRRRIAAMEPDQLTKLGASLLQASSLGDLVDE